jgi:hypothetical protein
MDHHTLSAFLEDDVQILLVTKIEELSDPNRIFCQTPKCTAGYISRDRIEGQWASCRTCQRSTCVECRAPAADHVMPAVYPDKIEALDAELANKE